MRRRAPYLFAAALLAVSLVACSKKAGGPVKVVASFYPLAWAAQQVGGSRVSVEDLTPPGTEAHDTQITAAQRADIQTGAVVLMLGHGFQPQVQQAAQSAQGVVVSVGGGLVGTENQSPANPHVWLDPVLMEQVVAKTEGGLAKADPSAAAGFKASAAAVQAQLAALDKSYAAGLSSCRFTTFVTTHEAFGYVAERYGLNQLGVEGIVPESEPTAARIQLATQAIQTGKAAPAVFYEATDAGRRIGQSVAADAGVRPLPLGTLESQPDSGDYMTVMRQNLVELEKGLQCKP